MDSKNNLGIKMNNIQKVRQTARPSTYWNQSLLDETRHKYLNEVKTVDHWYQFLQKNIHPLASYASSSYPLNYKDIDYPINVENFTFMKIGEIKSFDVSMTLEKIYNDNPNINANNSQNCKIREENFKDEIKFLENMGFDKYPHVFIPSKNNYPEIYKLLDKFELDYYTAQVRIQAPGSTQETHTDTLDCMWGELVRDESNEDLKNITQLPFDPVTKCPDGYYAIRLLIAFTKFEPGHVIGFEDQYWTNWDQGDIITFDWANIFHFTANTSFTPRIVFKITGITSDPMHWIFDAINNNKVITL